MVGNKNKVYAMFRNMKHAFSPFMLLIGLFLLSWNSAYCQQDSHAEPDNDLNAVYISAGTAVLWHGISATYERTLKDRLFNKNISSFAKLSAGYYLMWDLTPSYGGPWTFSHYGWLVGKDTHHFEISAGITYAFTGDLSGLFPSGTIGYRYKKPQGKFIFRANASFPEGLNLGAGFTF
mgnify:CR=1 FL=1|tara:strand:- start:897 stop:1430 length:534 start_codon:yes stop_codon:yes gene_type:complete